MLSGTTGKEETGELKSSTLNSIMERWRNGTLGEIWIDWKWIFSYSGKFRGPIALYTVLGVLSSTLGLVSAVASKFLVDVVIGRKVDQLWIAALVMLGSALSSLALSNTTNRLKQKLDVDMTNVIRADVFDSVMDAGWQSLNQFSSGDILNRFHGDIGTVSGNAISWIPSTIISTYNFVASFIVIWYYNPVMSLIALSSAPVMLLMSRYLMRKQKTFREEMMKSTSNLYSFEAETLHNLDTVKSFGVMNTFSEQLKDLQLQYRNITLTWNLFQIHTNIFMTVVGLLVSYAAYGYALYLLWGGSITYGTMTLFLQQRGSLSGAFQSLVGIVPSFISSSVSAHRIQELMNLPREKHHHAEIPSGFFSGRLTVCFRGIDFGYEDGEALVLEQSDLEARPGQITALVGPSGEGKTTVLRLLLGIVEPLRGESVFRMPDGEELAVTAESRQLISYVPQGNTLLKGSIAENLRLARPDATEEQIREALQMAGAWEFVEKLPDGMDSPVRERGRSLSEGQAQRVSIARALLRDAPIILMDEATSALDVETERTVLRNILKRAPEKTFILTTHRPTVLSMCDRVYRVVERKITQLSQEEIDVITRNF